MQLCAICMYTCYCYCQLFAITQLVLAVIVVQPFLSPITSLTDSSKPTTTVSATTAAPTTASLAVSEQPLFMTIYYCTDYCLITGLGEGAIVKSELVLASDTGTG